MTTEMMTVVSMSAALLVLGLTGYCYQRGRKDERTECARIADKMDATCAVDYGASQRPYSEHANWIGGRRKAAQEIAEKIRERR
jgi:hypothetical protein